MSVSDGIIELDTPFAKELGFTSDKFSGWLSKRGDYIYISLIESLNPRKGNLSKLFDRIQERGYGIKVPTPFPLMERILRKRGGFVKTLEPFAPEHGINDPCEVWVKEPIEKVKKATRELSYTEG